ncbi:MAG: hypothetical protein ABIA04_04535 [Pseudomonadota bacterium]
MNWEDFRKAYVDAGGDGFYGAWSVPYLEPVIESRQFAYRCPWVYENIAYEKGICPIAESIQPKLMQFKTNYRDLNLASEKAGILAKVIKKIKA